MNFKYNQEIERQNRERSLYPCKFIFNFETSSSPCYLLLHLKEKKEIHHHVRRNPSSLQDKVINFVEESIN